jgi:hypothetical protein
MYFIFFCLRCCQRRKKRNKKTKNTSRGQGWMEKTPHIWSDITPNSTRLSHCWRPWRESKNRPSSTESEITRKYIARVAHHRDDDEKEDLQNYNIYRLREQTASDVWRWILQIDNFQNSYDMLDSPKTSPQISIRSSILTPQAVTR